MKKIIYVIFLLFTYHFTIGQCETALPIINKSYIEICAPRTGISNEYDLSDICYYYPSGIIADSITWYRVINNDTIEFSNSSHPDLPETQNPGTYNYVVTNKNGCESDFVTFTIKVNPRPEITLNYLPITYSDTSISIETKPKGGSFTYNDICNGYMYMNYCYYLPSQTHSSGLDSVFTIQLIEPDERKENNCYHYASYTFTDENGCTNTKSILRELVYPDAPIAPDTIYVRTNDTIFYVKAQKEEGCILSWNFYDYHWLFESQIGVGDSIRIPSSLYPHYEIVCDCYTEYEKEIQVKNVIGNKESGNKKIILKFYDCLATAPILNSNEQTVLNGSTFPTIEANSNYPNCQIKWYNANTYNKHQENIPLTTGNSYTISSVHDVCVVNYDTVAKCESNCANYNLQVICTNFTYKPSIDSLIRDTVFNNFQNKQFSISNTLLTNQVCKWYIEDSTKLSSISPTFQPSLPYGTTKIFVSIYDTLQQCESYVQKCEYIKTHCSNNFKYPDFPYIIYVGDTIPTGKVIAPNQRISWYHNDSLVHRGSEYTPDVNSIGYYTYKIELDSGRCNLSTSVLFSYISNTIRGNVNFPYIYNNISKKGQIIRIMPTNEFITTDENGNFIYHPKEYGTYTFSYMQNANYVLADEFSEFSCKIDDITHNYNITFNAKPNMSDDLSISIVDSPPIVGRFYYMYINTTNFGQKVYNIPIELHYSQFLNYLECSKEHFIKNDTTITYYIDSIEANSNHIDYFTFRVLEDPNITGDTLFLKAKFGNLNYVIGNNNIQNDSDSLYSVILNSADPNDKSVSPSFKKEGYVVLNTPLTYTIRFQNTGTIDAENIYITDTINNNLDLSTFEIISQSHNMGYSINDRVITFLFNNIHLPDSTTNENESHGYVKYRLKPKSNLPENTIISNTAYIYFDYNDAVKTNSAISTYVTYLPLDKIETRINQNANKIKVYPTKVRRSINFELDGNNQSIYITNLNGQNIITLHNVHGINQIDCSNLKNGVYFYKIISNNKTNQGYFIKVE